ncbi:SAM-dependent methyltransferase [Pedobacter changchengzhani]|uniref:SAM-dependent methyltransferase n=1 Tax=Pedobacter changchengzhani TaxID=2529274 RepID=A0A4R5MIV0_9SPHI|nr:class I SAM-dependent methyltransferase [Pedobacter changchengzhani]TDG35306.1 SAM-dependent methyltransferase [Pedobacter changchengzhani]
MESEEIWTGERLETYIFNENTIEHLHRYAIAIELTKNKVVLDIACGEGYGSNLLAESAKYVHGVDISPITIDKAQKKYLKSNLKFSCGSTSAIPLENQSIDVVVSFETIEHHDQHEQMMLEIKRVLKPKGLLIISSPDKLTYTDQTGNINPHHVRELYFEEFNFLLKRHFKNASFYFQKMIQGSIIYNNNLKMNFSEYVGDYSIVKEISEKTHIYVISIATNGELPLLGISLFDSKMINSLSIQDTHQKIESAVSKIKQSWSYRIGNVLLRPLSFFKSKFNA